MPEKCRNNNNSDTPLTSGRTDGDKNKRTMINKKSKRREKKFQNERREEELSRMSKSPLSLSSSVLTTYVLYRTIDCAIHLRTYVHTQCSASSSSYDYYQIRHQPWDLAQSIHMY